VLPLDEATEGVRDLEPAFVIYLGGVIAPKHGILLHIGPQKSTAIVEKACWVVNRKIMNTLRLRFFFAGEETGEGERLRCPRMLRCADLSIGPDRPTDHPPKGGWHFLRKSARHLF
jgi:hypothetical protein